MLCCLLCDTGCIEYLTYSLCPFQTSLLYCVRKKLQALGEEKLRLAGQILQTQQMTASV